MRHKILTITILCIVALISIQCKRDTGQNPIDRYALVTRHNIEWNDLTGQIPLGNGEFCFNADGTGLQTFGGNTMSHWGWHSFPLPDGVTSEQIPATGTFQQGRNAGPDIFPEDKDNIRQYMFDNPHIFNLGRISFAFANGVELTPDDVEGLSRSLDLWNGILSSSFTINGQPVHVATCVNPNSDMVSVQIESPLLETGELVVAIDFPYPNLERYKPWVGDFEQIDKHKTILLDGNDQRADFRREVDSVTYFTSVIWSKGAELKPISGNNPHAWQLATEGVNSLEFTCAYSKSSDKEQVPDFVQTSNACKQHWPEFWQSGGAIDLSESTDPRWKELERRIVLSQYQTAVQSAGSFPSAEGGLMGIGPWKGQFHMEMIWWHTAHFALWDRWELADSALTIYKRFTPSARALAEQLDYEGLKWQKSASPGGRTAPWLGNQVLLWKQPHPIFFAELDYRLHPTQKTLEKWADIIDGTATHMADYPVKDESGIYHLDPVMPPSEQGITKDAVFDLAYWTWGLNQAQVWRERMDLERVPHWDEIINNMASLPVDSGVYVHSAEWKDTYTTRAWEHPDPIGVLGMLPNQSNVDPEIAHRTLLKVWDAWQWERCWGWDFPWTAMAAARLGEPNLAIDALLKDAGTKNYYDERGVCTGGPCPYLPGNGGLLYAVAMMSAGWDGAPDKHAPGFPDDGSWTVKWEGLKPAL
ncbi:hypothetical protein [Draconibacterium mangrovi]|uniref:hypothetical protein n=1 Tax=Draconibacterium mangrovi TaxID=2697469 RepID=UPI0013D78BFD|nr:hypothetical protein [Draconibacterium mangrovi]